MKRYSLAVFLGMTVMLLALAPQLRADGTDHFNDADHNNTIASTFQSHGMDVRHADWWKSDNDNDGDGLKWFCSHSGSSSSSSSSSNYGNGNCCDSTGSNGGGTVSTPEPSSLLLLLSGFLAAAVGMALKKAAA